MDSGFYLFTAFIFVLIIIIMLVAKRLFADVKRQNKLLDEKETKLLRLYATLEEVMEEFYDTVNDSKQDIDSAVRRLNEQSGRVSTAPPRVVFSQDAPVQKEKPKIIDYIVDDSPEEPDPTPVTRTKPFGQLLTQASEDSEPISGSVRNENIMSLHRKGKSNTDIARELGITQTEVSLVIGLNSK